MLGKLLKVWYNRDEKGREYNLQQYKLIGNYYGNN